MSLSFSDGSSTGILGGKSPVIVANPVGMTATVSDDASYKMVGAKLGSSKDGYFGSSVRQSESWEQGYPCPKP